MRLLIIEDEAETRDFLRKALAAEGFAVDSAEDGERGSYLARTNDYDLILLDNMLPKKQGIEVCREIKRGAEEKRIASRKNSTAKPVHVPRIILVSAKSDPIEKADLLNEGADDYMTKPFSLIELSARTSAVLRRPAITEEEVLAVGDLTLDRNRQRVSQGNRQIYLTKKEFTLLEYLLRNKGKFLSRGAILEHVWDGDGNPFSNSIETHMANLRKKIEIGENGQVKKLIYSLTGRGYKIDTVA